MKPNGILIIIFLTSSLCSKGQIDYTFGHQRILPSNELGESISVHVGLPETQHDPTLMERYPVSYVLDGDLYFPLAHLLKAW